MSVWFVKVGVLEPAEAEAPATPSKEAVKGSIETVRNPLSHPLAELRNPHAEPSEDYSFLGEKTDTNFAQKIQEFKPRKRKSPCRSGEQEMKQYRKGLFVLRKEKGRGDEGKRERN